MEDASAGSDAPPQSALDETILPSDERRAQELDHYFRPGKSFLKTDTILPAYMQLISWRLGMQRALVSLIDRDTQFFVAEGTRTMDLLDSSIFDCKDDAIWAGCSSVPKAGRLCAETLVAADGPNAETAYFEVCDLSSDQRFRELGFITGEPYFRYYCGVPIRTKRNIAIGSVFVLDDQIHAPMDSKLVRFLRIIADNVMAYFETRKETMDIKRIMKMNKSLAQFVGADYGENAPTHDDEQSAGLRPDGDSTDKGSADHPHDQLSAQVPPDVENFSENSQQSTRKSSVSSAMSKSDDEVPGANPARDYNQIFDRAAFLLQQCMALQDGGGVILLDTASDSATPSSGVRRGSENKKRKEDGRNLSVTTPSEPPLSRTPSDEVTKEDGSKAIAAVLSQSCCLEKTQNRESRLKSASRVPVKTLLKFIKKGPGGRLYYYPQLNSGCTGESRPELQARLRENKEEAALTALFSHFPGARQLLLVPFWNTHLSRWSVCLVFNNTTKREFTFEIDYYYCRAFCNCVKAEIDRCTIILSDEQKGQFIGSVSHELRSPLHGILASCELLAETELTTFQSSLIDTTESCAHTLLDTINMVLDYSKINAFRQCHPPEGLNVKPHIVKGGVEPLLSVYSSVNIAAVTEEVIEGITTGHLAKINPNVQLDDSTNRDRSEDMTETPGVPLNIKKPSVEIILDVSPPLDWFFVTQPGAFRRVIMNIFGNSVKYTETGFIKVSLGCDNIKDSDPSSAVITLVIADSGKGISKTYMQTRLFTAFAQENALAPGVGLGLSLVRSLVDMLNGHIDIHSNLNCGTTVTVKIPMKRTASASLAEDSFRKPRDGNVTALRQRTPRPHIVVFQDALVEEPSPQWRGHEMQHHALSEYLSGWYDLETSEGWSFVPEPDVIVADDVFLPALQKHLEKFDRSKGPALVILCTNRSHTNAIAKSVNYPRVEVMPKPFGPFKLAKVLKLALEQSTSTPNFSSSTLRTDEDSVGMKIEEGSKRPAIKRTDIAVSPGQVVAALPTVRRIPSIRDTRSTGGFPFPTMVITPSTRPGTPVKPPSPQLESQGTHHRRLKTLDVLVERQDPQEKYNELVRSRSDSHMTREIKHHKPKILLVDDNEVNLKLLQTYFIRHDHKNVGLARDGSQAVKTYEKALQSGDPYHIIFMDISMPIMNGFEATKNIRHIESTTAAQRFDQSTTPTQALIIALTGNASSKDQADAFTHGIDLYMTKPVSLKEVGALMRIWEDNATDHGAERARPALLEINASSDNQK